MAAPRHGLKVEGRPVPAADGEHLAPLRRSFATASDTRSDTESHTGRGLVEWSFTAAGIDVRLRSVGDRLASVLLPALDHHPPARTTSPHLSISAWDVAATGAPLPPIPPGVADGRGGTAERVGGPPEVRWRYDAGCRMLTAFDRRTSEAWCCVADASDLPGWELASPLRVVFHWALAERARHLVHAAAVATPAGGVLLAGRGGSGKSSAALACFDAGLGYVADDYCVLEWDGTIGRAHNLYGTAKVDRARLGDLRALAPAAVEGADVDGKAVLLLGRVAPEPLTPSVPVRAVLVPMVEGTGPSRLEPVTPAAALAALAPSTIFQLPGAGAGALRITADVVRAVPAARLVIGARLADVPSLVIEAAEQFAAAAR